MGDKVALCSSSCLEHKRQRLGDGKEGGAFLNLPCFAGSLGPGSFNMDTTGRWDNPLLHFPGLVTRSTLTETISPG